MKLRLGSLVFFLGGFWLVYILFWPGSGGTWIELTVEPGMIGQQVIHQLQEKGLLHSRIPFLIWSRLRQADSRIRVGRYRFSKGRSAFWVVDDLIKGRTEKIKLVVPEGFSSWQIAERLDAIGICSGSAFLKVVQEKKLEGLLFPATYEFEYGLAPESIAQKMKDKFDHEWTSEFETRSKELSLSKKEVVILASIVEREIRVRDELPMVSAVYHNRLKKKMQLDADPTVQYALGFWKKRLTYDDYHKTKSPYNTYINFGLPPGPICSPGLDAVKAALWPAETDALYLLATEDGHHTFSTNLREHTNKVNVRNRGNKKNMVERKP